MLRNLLRRRVGDRSRFVRPPRSADSGRRLLYLNRLVPLDLGALNVMAGLRAAFACAVPVMVAALSGREYLGWIAIAGFWTSLCDTGGAWTDRLKAMSAFTALATAGCFIGTLLEPYAGVSVLFCFAWCFATSFARIYGNAASTVGLLLSSAILVTLGLPDSGFDEAARIALLTLIGGIWSMLLSLILWRLQPYGPARKAVARCWSAIAEYADALAQLHRRNGHDSQAWSTLASARRRAVREAIEVASTVAVATRRTRAGATRQGQVLIALLADADQVSAALIGLNEMLEAASHSSADISVRRAIRVVLGRLAERSEQLAQQQLDGSKASVASRDVVQAIDRLQRRITASSARREHAYTVELLQQVARWIDAAFDNFDQPRTSQTHLTAMLEQAIVRRLRLRDLWTTAAANFSFRSIVFRHALRLAATASFAVLTARVFEVSRGYWISITAIVVLQPYMAETWRRSFDRIAGSLLGTLIAAWLLQLVATPLQMTLLIFPLCVFAFTLRSVNYALFMLCMTPLVVLIAELFQTGGIGDPYLSSLRAIDSLCGGLIGLCAGFLLWPSWEKPQFPKQMADAIRAHRNYLMVVLGSNPAAQDEDIGAARRQTGLTSNNAEASLQRVLSERSLMRRADIEPALIVLACLRRMGGVIVTLSLLPPFTAGKVEHENHADLRDWGNKTLTDLAEALEGHRAPAALPPIPAAFRSTENGLQQGLTTTPVEQIIENELLRLSRQLQVMHDAIGRLASASFETTPKEIAV
jgi:uncharacterized membrane protein YccC